MPNDKGWGGSRKGAGRKPIGQAPAVPMKVEYVTTTPSGAPLTCSQKALKYADMALETLATIASQGVSEASRVSAARELLDRAYGTPGPAEPKQGKKEAAAEAAKVVGSGSDWGDDLRMPGAGVN